MIIGTRQIERWENLADSLHESTVDRTTVDGLDRLLEESVDTENTDPGQVAADDWSLEEAADYLGLSIKTIRRRLRDGKLDGYKIIGLNGPEWRIRQICLDNDQGQTRTWSTKTSMVQSNHAPTTDVTLVRDLISKVEALTYRNGYLESQLAERNQQIKLLTNNQCKGGWWRRAWRWFTGGGTSV